MSRALLTFHMPFPPDPPLKSCIYGAIWSLEESQLVKSMRFRVMTIISSPRDVFPFECLSTSLKYRRKVLALVDFISSSSSSGRYNAFQWQYKK